MTLIADPKIDEEYVFRDIRPEAVAACAHMPTLIDLYFFIRDEWEAEDAALLREKDAE